MSVEMLSRQAFIDQVRFDRDGLVPAIAQSVEDGRVLMMAYMNLESLIQTFETGLATYWSRSRRCLWVKGETSGHAQKLEAIRLDCDGDTVLLTVSQIGPACHTGSDTCFFRSVLLEKDSKTQIELMLQKISQKRI